MNESNIISQEITAARSSGIHVLQIIELDAGFSAIIIQLFIKQVVDIS